MISFGSDNHSPAHPRVLEALERVNRGYVPAYGADPWTQEAEARLKDLFGAEGVFLTLNGTGTNVLALKSLLQPWEAVVAPQWAHIQTDEAGAPETAGIKILPLASPQGKPSPEDLKRLLSDLENPHHGRPGVLSLSQTTEWGTVFTPQEFSALVQPAREAGLRIHLDGARLAQALTAQNLEPRALTRDLGVDALSLGFTKNGALGAEALVVFNPQALPGLPWLRKQYLQLASKMRYVSAQILALLEGDLWLENARSAHRQAQVLAQGLQGLPGVNFEAPPQANALFVKMPPSAALNLQEKYHFYFWDEEAAVVRLMTSWCTTGAEVEEFLFDLRKSLAL